MSSSPLAAVQIALDDSDFVNATNDDPDPIVKTSGEKYNEGYKMASVENPDIPNIDFSPVLTQIRSLSTKMSDASIFESREELGNLKDFGRGTNCSEENIQIARGPSPTIPFPDFDPNITVDDEPWTTTSQSTTSSNNKATTATLHSIVAQIHAAGPSENGTFNQSLIFGNWKEIFSPNVLLASTSYIDESAVSSTNSSALGTSVESNESSIKNDNAQGAESSSEDDFSPFLDYLCGPGLDVMDLPLAVNYFGGGSNVEPTIATSGLTVRDIHLVNEDLTDYFEIREWAWKKIPEDRDEKEVALASIFKDFSKAIFFCRYAIPIDEVWKKIPESLWKPFWGDRSVTQSFIEMDCEMWLKVIFEEVQYVVENVLVKLQDFPAWPESVEEFYISRSSDEVAFRKRWFLSVFNEPTGFSDFWIKYIFRDFHIIDFDQMLEPGSELRDSCVWKVAAASTVYYDEALGVKAEEFTSYWIEQINEVIDQLDKRNWEAEFDDYESSDERDLYPAARISGAATQNISVAFLQNSQHSMPLKPSETARNESPTARDKIMSTNSNVPSSFDNSGEDKSYKSSLNLTQTNTCFQFNYGLGELVESPSSLGDDDELSPLRRAREGTRSGSTVTDIVFIKNSYFPRFERILTR